MSSQNDYLNIDLFEKREKISSGSFGEVFKIIDKKTGEIYAAKISHITINDPKSIILIVREVNINAGINHPSVIKFIGYSPNDFNHESKPVIVTQYFKNGSLLDIINLERQSRSVDGWDDTKKLLTIYGIASGMSYLHSHDILHRDLKPSNILMDDFLLPKIADFGLSKIINNGQETIETQSSLETKGTPIYMSPEIIESQNYTKAGDVYAFGIILFQIMTNEEPFKKINGYNIFKKVVEGERPTFPFKIPDSYHNLIKRCWSQNPDERPNFDSIVEELKTNPEFITDLVDKEDFAQYVIFIDEYRSTFDKTKKIIRIEDFIQNKKSSTFRKVLVFPYNQTKRLICGLYSWFFKQEKLFPLKEFDDLNEICKKIVEEAENDPEKQFLVGTFLIEGKNDFPQNIEIGIKYLERSISKGCLDSVVYLSQILIEGKLIPSDFLRAKKYLSQYLNKDDGRVFLLYGKILKKENKKSEARSYFQKGCKKGNSEAMYKYGKMLFLGEGGEKNESEAINFLNISQNNGFQKSEKYLNVLNEMNKKNQSFSNLPSETKHFFIKQIIKNEMKEIVIRTIQLKSLFKNNSLLSPDFINVLHLFESVLIDIAYQCSNYDSIMDQLSQLKNENFSDIKYFLIVKKANSIDHRFGKQNIISYVSVKSSVKVIKKKTFFGCSLLEKIRLPSSLNEIRDLAFYGCSSLLKITIPPSVTSIGCQAFKGCSTLTQIIIPPSVSSIGSYAFKGCLSLETVSLSSSLTKIEEGTFNKCCSLVEIEIPSSVTEIGKSSFKKCSSLQKIKIPSSVNSINAHAFKKCTSLTDVSLSPSMEEIDQSLFAQCSSLKEVSIPDSIKKIGNSAFKDCSSLTQITMTNSLLAIEGQAFCGCSSLEKVSIPSSVTCIGSSAFQDCPLLNEIEIPMNVSLVCESTFNGCSALVQITIPSSVTSIGCSAFKGCSSLTEMLIPSSVKSIGEAAFADCNSLVKITMPSFINEIKKSVFENCSSLSQISIPLSVKKIDSNSFLSCTSLEEIEIPSSVSCINRDAFKGCSALKKISIPSSLESFDLEEVGISSDDVVIIRTT